MRMHWATTGLAALIVALFLGNLVMLKLEERDLIRLVDAYRDHHERYILAARMRQSTNDLTRLARTYAITGDDKFLDQYLKILETRDGKLAEPAHYDWVYWDFLAVDGREPPSELTTPISYEEVIARAGLNEHERQLLLQARQESDKLAEFEKSVFTQAPWLPGSTAAQQLFDANYHRAKLDILSRVNAVFHSLDLRSRNRVLTQQSDLEHKQAIQYWMFWALMIAGTTWIAMTYRLHKIAIAKLDQEVAKRTASLNKSNQKLESAMKEIKTLQGLLPICSYCHSVCDENGSWLRIEDYISMRSEARFTHGMCPTCYQNELNKFKPKA